eukprot:TRINITY_DN361_c0_g1_i18.p1 TRINITY_DN361_c0_g1~~TRINITY_DN361_c0_g1_i18.p1  ORF type:complete len:486 (+),score=13.67 TRINITY_DN361_c0_g1_i18:423-1880(+)
MMNADRGRGSRERGSRGRGNRVCGNRGRAPLADVGNLRARSRSQEEADQPPAKRARRGRVDIARNTRARARAQAHTDQAHVRARHNELRRARYERRAEEYLASGGARGRRGGGDRGSGYSRRGGDGDSGSGVTSGGGGGCGRARDGGEISEAGRSGSGSAHAHGGGDGGEGGEAGDTNGGGEAHNERPARVRTRPARYRDTSIDAGRAPPSATPSPPPILPNDPAVVRPGGFLGIEDCTSEDESESDEEAGDVGRDPLHATDEMGPAAAAAPHGSCHASPAVPACETPAHHDRAARVRRRPARYRDSDHGTGGAPPSATPIPPLMLSEQGPTATPAPPAMLRNDPVAVGRGGFLGIEDCTSEDESESDEEAGDVGRDPLHATNEMGPAAAAAPHAPPAVPAWAPARPIQPPLASMEEMSEMDTFERTKLPQTTWSSMCAKCRTDSTEGVEQEEEGPLRPLVPCFHKSLNKTVLPKKKTKPKNWVL